MQRSGSSSGKWQSRQAATRPLLSPQTLKQTQRGSSQPAASQPAASSSQRRQQQPAASHRAEDDAAEVSKSGRGRGYDFSRRLRRRTAPASVPSSLPYRISRCAFQLRMQHAAGWRGWRGGGFGLPGCPHAARARTRSSSSRRGRAPSLGSRRARFFYSWPKRLWQRAEKLSPPFSHGKAKMTR